MKAVIYARVSTEEQAKDVRTSLRCQLQQSHEYREQCGYDLLEEVVDAGFSGLSMDTPGLQRIRELAEGEAFVLIAWSSDRLSRDVIRRRLLAETMRTCGGRIEYATEKYEDSDTGEALQDIVQAMHWLHARKNRENVWRGQYQKAKEGKYIPRYVRLGYNWTELTPEGRKAPGASFVVNPEEAEVIRLIFDLYQKLSFKRVAIWLNEHNYLLPCKSPKLRERYGRTEQLFRDCDIMTIIKDDLYTGTVTWGKTTKLTGKTPETFSNHIPELQIISFEQFNRAQSIIKERRLVPPKSVSSHYTFSGLLRCPKCGGRTVSRLNASRGYAEKQRQYTCSNYHRYGSTQCTGWMMFEQTARKAVLEFLTDLFENKLSIREHLEAEARAMALEGEADKAQRAKKIIEQGKHELRRIQELALREVMNSAEAAGFVREAREKIERAENQLKAMETQIRVKGELAEAIGLLDQDLAGVLESLDGQGLSRLCRQVFKSVTVEAWGIGPNRQCRVAAYEFTSEMRDLLAGQLTHTPEFASR